MATDYRYGLVQSAIRKGQITTLRQIFDYIPSEVVAKDLKMRPKKFNALINKTGKFRLGQILDLVALMEVPEIMGFNWVIMQYRLDRQRGV